MEKKKVDNRMKEIRDDLEFYLDRMTERELQIMRNFAAKILM